MVLLNHIILLQKQTVMEADKHNIEQKLKTKFEQFSFTDSADLFIFSIDGRFQKIKIADLRVRRFCNMALNQQYYYTDYSY